jgi:hypothetical protein
MKLTTMDPSAIVKTKPRFSPRTRKTAIPTIAGEAHKHRRQADRQRQAARQLDLRAEQQHERRDQQLAPRLF